MCQGIILISPLWSQYSFSSKKKLNDACWLERKLQRDFSIGATFPKHFVLRTKDVFTHHLIMNLARKNLSRCYSLSTMLRVKSLTKKSERGNHLSSVHLHIRISHREICTHKLHTVAATSPKIIIFSLAFLLRLKELSYFNRTKWWKKVEQKNPFIEFNLFKSKSLVCFISTKRMLMRSSSHP